MLRKFCVIIAGILILVLLPLFYLKDMNNRLVSDYVESRMTRFMASVMNSDSIDDMAYKRLQNEIAATDRICNIEMEHLITKEVLIASGDEAYAGEAVVAEAIVPEKEYIETQLNEIPDLNIYLVYSDGSKEKIDDYSTNFNPEQGGLQYVTIEYAGFITYIEVYVKTEYICEICGSKSIRDVSSETGCDICKNTPQSLFISPEYADVMQGDIPELTVLVYYMDGHIELTEDWTGNVDTSVIGERIVTIGYGGVTAEIVINVIENVDYGGTGGEGADSGGSDSGGTGSKEEGGTGGGDDGESGGTGGDGSQDGDVGTEYFSELGYGQVSNVNYMTYSHEILEIIQKDGSYAMNDGDYFSLRIEEKANTYNVMDAIFGLNNIVSKVVGGRI